MTSPVLRLVPAFRVRAAGPGTGSAAIDFDAHPPDARLIDRLGVDAVLAQRALPWRRIGGATVVATSDREGAASRRALLEQVFGPVMLAQTDDASLHAALLRQRRRALVTRAETRVVSDESCRTLLRGRGIWLLALCLVVLAAAAALAPVQAFTVLAGWATLTLIASIGLRVAAGLAQWTRPGRDRPAFASARVAPAPRDLPTVSLLVPLFREREIAGRLIDRLGRLDYPADKLDICLIAEANDTITQATIRSAGLPAHMRLIPVPRGTLQTKPRALNYALDFARGTIIGVYDAEDAPAPDQITRVVNRFAQSRQDVACLQGVLDFYNPAQNWLSRCFTVDYAVWFRILLPGLARLGLVVPLGGTTLFFRRAVIEALGGWDAHNVTEDADLGLRLARRGFRTELIDTVTLEEANCHPWPWIRQRSRWLKGYAVTYAVHMRSPRRLWSDLGPWRFLGVQILFLGSLSQFVLAPVLWSFWLLPLGFPHPLAEVLPWGVVLAMSAAFLLSEGVNIALGCAAVSGPRHRWLIPWVPTLHLYWPLGAIASYKALIELGLRPFYWDKTAHGMASGPAAADLHHEDATGVDGRPAA